MRFGVGSSRTSTSRAQRNNPMLLHVSNIKAYGLSNQTLFTKSRSSPLCGERRRQRISTLDILQRPRQGHNLALTVLCVPIYLVRKGGTPIEHGGRGESQTWPFREHTRREHVGEGRFGALTWTSGAQRRACSTPIRGTHIYTLHYTLHASWYTPTPCRGAERLESGRLGRTAGPAARPLDDRSRMRRGRGDSGRKPGQGKEKFEALTWTSGEQRRACITPIRATHGCGVPRTGHFGRHRRGA